MLAWIIDPSAPTRLSLTEIPDPVAPADEVVVQVDAFAPNPGDLAALATAPAGQIPGWDGAGTVLRPSASGTGPQAGDRVVFLGLSGGWAQQRLISTAMLAPASAELPVEHLATLPVAATSALRALRKLGSILGRRVLIVGATSAVGAYAVQLAARSGATVIAVARDQQQHHRIRRLGAAQVHATVSTIDTAVHGAVDLIGGQHLVDTYQRLAPGATVIALGHAAGADEVFPYGAFVADPSTADRSITSFFLGTEPDLAAEMTVLANDPSLDSGAHHVRPWTELADWITDGALRTAGRAVFTVT